MNKIFFLIFILIIFSFSFLSAYTFGISPGTIKLSEKINEVACKNFTLLGDNASFFNGEIKWSHENSRNILDYTITSDKLKINSQLPLEIKPGTYSICISSETAGNYYGALKYKLDNSSYGVGTWIELDVGEEHLSPNVLSATGDAIQQLNIQKVFLFSPIIFLVILFLLMKKIKGKDKTEFNSEN